MEQKNVGAETHKVEAILLSGRKLLGRNAHSMEGI